MPASKISDSNPIETTSLNDEFKRAYLLVWLDEYDGGGGGGGDKKRRPLSLFADDDDRVEEMVVDIFDRGVDSDAGNEDKGDANLSAIFPPADDILASNFDFVVMLPSPLLFNDDAEDLL